MGKEGSLVQEAETPYVILMASEPAVLAVVAHAVLFGLGGDDDIYFTDYPSGAP